VWDRESICPLRVKVWIESFPMAPQSPMRDARFWRFHYNQTIYLRYRLEIKLKITHSLHPVDPNYTLDQFSDP